MMAFKHWLGKVTLVGVICLASCATHKHAPAAAPTQKTAAPEASKPASPENVRVLPRRAQAPDEERTKRVNARIAALSHYSAALSAEAEGSPADALDHFYQAGMADPYSVELIEEVAQRLLLAQKKSQAYDVLSQAMNVGTLSGKLCAQFGNVCQGLGKNKEAIAASRKAVELLPTDIVGYRQLLLLYLDEKNNAEAWKILEQGFKQAGDVSFFLDLSELYTKYRKEVSAQADLARARALEALDRARNLKPATLFQAMRLADGYTYLGEFKQAVTLYLSLQKEFANEPTIATTVREKLTDLYLRSKDRPKAMAELMEIIKDNPTSPQAYYTLGWLNFEDKNWDRAIENFQKTILLNPDFEMGYYDLAAAQLSANKPEAALAVLEKARQKYPHSFLVEYYTGLAQNRAKNYPAALKAYTAAEVIARAGEKQRLTPLFNFQMGAALERNKQYAEAEKYFKSAIDQDPKFAEALNYLGYMWAERGEKLEQAQDYIERALKEEPDNGAFLDSLGWVYHQRGNNAKALDYIQQSIKHTTEPDATLYEHLGDVEAALKNWKKAREAWQKSLEIEANEAVKKKLDAAPAP